MLESAPYAASFTILCGFGGGLKEGVWGFWRVKINNLWSWNSFVMVSWPMLWFLLYFLKIRAWKSKSLWSFEQPCDKRRIRVRLYLGQKMGAKPLSFDFESVTMACESPIAPYIKSQLKNVRRLQPKDILVPTPCE